MEPDLEKLRALLRMREFALGKKTYEMSSVQAAARKLLRDFNSEANPKELATMLFWVYVYITETQKVTWNGMTKQMRSAVELVMEGIPDAENDSDDPEIRKLMMEQEIRNQIYNDFWNVATLDSFTEEKQREINRLKSTHIRLMDKLKKLKKELLEDLYEEKREKTPMK